MMDINPRIVIIMLIIDLTKFKDDIARDLFETSQSVPINLKIGHI